MVNRPSISSIVADLRKFGLRETLGIISQIAVKLWDYPGRHYEIKGPGKRGKYVFPDRVVVSTHSLAGLARIVLGSGFAFKSDVPTVEDVVYLQNRVAGLPTNVEGELYEEGGLERLMFQLSNQQFRFQIGGNQLDLARTLVLYERVPELLQTEGFEAPFNLEDKFEEISGMKLITYIWSGFMLLTKCFTSSSPYLSDSLTEGDLSMISKSWRGSPDDRPSNESFGKFIAINSLDLGRFRDRIGDLRRKDERLISLDYEPLLTYPVVRTGQQEIVVPIPNLLIDRISTGIFHLFSAHMEGVGRHNPFRSYFGRIFDRYVGMQLSLVFSSEDIMPEQQYGDGRHTPDWFINTSEDPIAIECRSSTFRSETRKSANFEMIMDDLTRIGSDAITGISRKVEDIRTGQTPIRMKSNQDPMIALCTWEDLRPLGLFGGLLHRRLTETMERVPQGYFLIPITMLEAMCSFQDRSSFINALGQLKVEPGWLNPHDEGPEKRWESSMPSKIPKNPILEEADAEIRSVFSIKI